jgi:hypothetical protein
MYSFVLEKIYLDDGVPGSKRINIVLHAFNGALVMWLLFLLLAHAGLPWPAGFAVLAGGAWLLSPLYVSTVLYVVQRMAMLATSFMLMAAISHVYWRRALFRGGGGWLYLALVIVFILLSVLAKENGVLIVHVIVLMELLWFQGRDESGGFHPWLGRGALVLLVTGATGMLLLFLWKFDRLQAGFASRDFSLAERLLTQARILWDYLGQLLWPDPGRMGVFHDDYVLSQSLTAPAATLYAVLGWLVVVLAGLYLLRYREGRLLVFAASLFLVGHALESSVVALELYFEHRNYFPGVGIFLLLATLAGLLSVYWRQVGGPLLVYFALYVALLAFQTSSQVQIWSSAPLLRLNHVNNHPQSFRANEEMALHLGAVGALESALDYSRRAGELSGHERVGDRQIRDLALYCLAGQPVPENRLRELGQQHAQRPFAVVSSFNGFVRVLQSEACPEFSRLQLADRLAEIFLVDGPPTRASANMYSVMAGLENHLGRFEFAHAYMNRFLTLKPGSTRGQLMQLHFATALGKSSEATELKAKLLDKSERGELNIGEQQTLDLYL